MTDTRQTHAQAELRTDIPRGNWIDRWLPAAARPYARLMRLDRPIGTWLLLFPCWWGLALAMPMIPTDFIPDGWFFRHIRFEYAALFAVGALVMRGAGCTYNDIVDREFDAKVARTALRPIPSGQVSVRAAFIFLAVQLLIGLVILLQFNRPTILLGIASLLLVFTYPLMKRITYWPQAFLGLTFNWGILMGWTAIVGRMPVPMLLPFELPVEGGVPISAAHLWSPLLLYAGAIAWTLHYDTIYAHQDKEDDALIGVKSTALKFGSTTKPWLCLFSTAAVLLFALAFYTIGVSWPAWVGLAAVALHLAWQIRAVDLNDPVDCLAKFHANRWIGWMLLAGIVAGKIYFPDSQGGIIIEQY
jgi:4-hydroxybenzoate polyprenyltransferase